jgi:hypothetical protein
MSCTGACDGDGNGDDDRRRVFAMVDGCVGREDQEGRSEAKKGKQRNAG